MKLKYALSTALVTMVSACSAVDSSHNSNYAAKNTAASTYEAPAYLPNGFATSQYRWQLLDDFSDEFNASSLDEVKWENAPKTLNVGAWTFAQPNAYVDNGNLVIEATQDTHTRKFWDSCWDGKAGGSAKRVDRTLYYKSGAVRTAQESVYGYYEAKMQGVKIFPGLSPAFWLYSDGHPFADRNDKSKQYVDYSEIDVVELQQADWRSPQDVDDQFDMDHNLHARVEENGRIVWKRPKPNREAQLLHYEAPFDPSLGFHTYAVENRKDKIIWYVDGVKVGEKPNKWWHRPMHVIFSMGLRRMFIKYNGKCQRADPNPNHVVQQGYPEDARMRVDYVRTWEVMPSIWVDDKAIALQAATPAEVTIHYHAGSNYHVVNKDYDGIQAELALFDANGLVKVIQTQNIPHASDEQNRYGGKVNVQFDLSNITPSSQLSEGQYYALQAKFNSSNGQQVTLLDWYKNITVN